MQFFHDKERDLLIYPGRHDALLRAIPEARAIMQDQYTALPRNLRNTQVLSYLQFPAPPLITDANYDWPIEPGKKPWNTQKLQANFRVMQRRCFDLSDPGTGKTLASLWPADWLMKQHAGEPFRCLIISTLSTIESVWANGIFRNFLGRRSVEILHGSAEKRRRALATPADFYVINYDGVGVGAHTRERVELDGFSQELARRDDIRLVIVDEASAYSDATTKRHKSAQLVFGHKDYLWLQTGTPTPNAPTDSFGLAKLVNNAFGKSFRQFQLETMIKVSMHKWVPHKTGYETARRLLAPAVRIPITDVWDGPEFTTQVRRIELTDAQKTLMKQLKQQLVITMHSGTPITALNEGAARNKFMQISMGAVYDEHHNVHLVDASPRFSEAIDIIESTERKVLIFVPLTSVVNLLYKKLTEYWKKHNLPWRASIINGQVSQKDRPKILDTFASDPNNKVILLDAQATAHGVNELVVADTVIWYGPIEKGELFTQGNKRAHRPGQKYPVTVFQLVSNPLEQEIFRRLENNQSLEGLLLGMVERGEF